MKLLGKIVTAEIVMDVVYAILIWRAFQLLPRPTKGDWSMEGMKAFMSANALGFVLVLVFLLIAIIYWHQNNVLFNNLVRTDGKHTALSIAQIFSLLLFLYAIKMGMDVGASAAITIPFSFVGPIVWELAWFIYPNLVKIFKRPPHENVS